MKTTQLPVRPDVTVIEAHRKPTPAEIRFGYGAIHYADFPVEEWLKEDGTLKKWIVSERDGLRYYRG